MKTYRRVEINAYRRRLTIVSGAWPSDNGDVPRCENAEEVSLEDSDVCEPVEPESPEGQLLLIDAVRSLEQRLSPETRALICAGQECLALSVPNRSGFYFRLQSVWQFIGRKFEMNYSSWSGNDASRGSME